MNTDISNLELIVKSAHDELDNLIQQRADITRRIGKIKQTIRGLCNLYGGDVLNDDGIRFLADRKPATRRPGLTQTCRAILRSSDRPLTARELSERIRQKNLGGAQSSRNLTASVAVVLDRLVQYGEARKVLHDNGRRAWLRISDGEDDNVPPRPEPPALFAS
ncbi:MAG TPA: hypothetical protein VND65_07790 [Candidatus Binatia bacterium]|nr:hypothetical protein [Candidatus Binatia bacterium]